MTRLRPRRAVAPGVAGVLLAAAVALLQLDTLPPWLAWCPPWLAASAAAGLGVCVVSVDRWRARRHAEADREQAVIDRLRRHAGRQRIILPRIGQAPATALALRVHPATDSPPSPVATEAPPGWLSRLLAPRRVRRRTDLPDLDLPLFVDRTAGPQVRQWMRRARTDGGFLLLVGDSCVGKTRLLYEAARQELPDFAVLAPDLGDGDLVNTIAQATFELPRLIIWLDELQRFLPGPYLTDGSVAITAATIRRLLDSPTPVVVAGTLWPAYAASLRAYDVDPDNPDIQRPRYPAAVDILTDRRIQEIRIDSFTQEEVAAAAQLATRDPRLATAIADPDHNVTEALAGARELTDRYERATHTQRAVLHAAIDARRVGIESPLTEDLLREAARAYLRAPYPDDAWFSPAMNELTTRHRPQDKTTAPLVRPSPSPGQRAMIGYTVTDYLLQHLSTRRRTEPIPTLAWQGFSAHAAVRDDLLRLADHAERRLRYDQALPIYQRLCDAGDEVAAYGLVHVLARQHNVRELRDRANSGDKHAAEELARLLVKLDRVDELRDCADSGDKHAAEELARLLRRQGHVGELRARADADDAAAAKELLSLLQKEGRVGELREWADAGNEAAAKELAKLLRKKGQLDELREWADTGNHAAAKELAKLLRKKGQLDELRQWADTGNHTAAKELAKLLGKKGRINELRDLAGRGDAFAAVTLADILVEQGHIDEAMDLFRSAAAAGSEYAADTLAWLLSTQDRLDEAISLLRGQFSTRQEDIRQPLAELLARQGHLDEALGILRDAVDAGNQLAVIESAQLLAEYDRVDEALGMLHEAVEANNPYAVGQLVKVLVKHDRVDEALDMLRTRSAAGDEHVASDLARLLAAQDRVGELRDWADTGDYHAQYELAELLAARNRLDELRTRADTGDSSAAHALAKLLISQGRIDELRLWADAGNEYAARKLVALLFDQGRTEELRSRAEAGDSWANTHLQLLLAKHGRLLEAQLMVLQERYADEGFLAREQAESLAGAGYIDDAINLLRNRVEAGDQGSNRPLFDLLRQHGRTDELRAEVWAGTHGAAEAWLAMLIEHGQADLADQIRRHGLTPD
ncbi:tetratricopeptide repeat protein [Phytohabitans houttuyneae]|uniref:Uncharacterized protein n=1 Tax=Phytohabitans houttuyneae TaxID=1076126 RepID=A0A6V8KMX6_9ACTN|nr:hypothetical protein [Phytohabitans houttuyneae]GFJ83306.1 hypothetical protein Phou_074860 [Phytohabitans houttuyneae]